MHNVTGDWSKVVVLCAILATGCANTTDGIIHYDEPSPPMTFAASGLWETEGPSSVSYRFSSFDDEETVGEFGGNEYHPGFWYYGDYTPPRNYPVNGRWENNQVSFTVHKSGEPVYSAEFGSDNPTRVGFKDSRGSPHTLVRSDSP